MQEVRPEELKQIGTYRVIKMLGAGGMGAVYHAIDESLQREVAVKLMLPRVAAREDFRRRFQQEAIAIAKLDHPNIVRVFSFNADEKMIYLVMEYVRYGSLGTYIREIFKEGRLLDLREALALTRHVASALDYAHRHQMIHRDVKPDNVLLKESLESGSHIPFNAVLTDFGLAKLREDQALLMTGEGQLMGTPPYMPPEQLRGEKVDGRVDLYALGIMLYQLTCGELPFKSRTLIEAMQMLDATPRPPSEIRPTISAELQQVMLKAIAKPINERFQTGQEMVKAITELERNIAAGPIGIALPAAATAERVESLATYFSDIQAKSILETPSFVPSGLKEDRVVARAAGKQSREIYLRRLPIIIGRDTSADIALESTRISRKHVRIDKVLGKYVIVDLGSTNGTLLGEKRLEVNVINEWSPADIVQLGEYQLQLQLAGEAHKVAPTEPPQPLITPSPLPSTSPPPRDVSMTEPAPIGLPVPSTKPPVIGYQSDPALRPATTPPSQPPISSVSLPTRRQSLWLLALIPLALIVGAGVTLLILAGRGGDNGDQEPQPVAPIVAAKGSETPTETQAPTFTTAFTATPAVTFSPTASPTATLTASATNSPSPSPSQTPSPTASPTATPTATLTNTPSPTASATASLTPSLTPTRTLTPSPSVTRTPTLTVTPSPTRTRTPSPEPTPAQIDATQISRLEQVGFFSGHTDFVYQVAVSPDGELIASAAKDGTVRVWDVRNQRELGTLQGHVGEVYDVAFSPSGAQIATVGQDAYLRIWNANTLQPEGAPMKGFSSPLNSVAFSPDGSQAAVISISGTIRIWSLETRSEVTAWQGHNGVGYAVDWSADGRYIASGGSDQRVYIWNAFDGRLAANLGRMGDDVLQVRFSADSSLLASASVDGTVTIWDIDRGSALTELFGHSGWANSAAFSPDNSLIVSCDDSGNIIFWRVRDGQQIASYPSHSGSRVFDVVFSPNQKYVVSGGRDTTVRVWGPPGVLN